MENIRNLRWFWPVLTLFGPIGFGSTYWVTHQFLPTDAPLWGATLRALPAGVVLLLAVHKLPRGGQWWRAFVLGTINMGAFFLLAFVAAQLLPSSIAASLGAASPLVIAFFGWVLLNERPRLGVIAAALLGIVGVVLIVGTTTDGLSLPGLAASVGMLVLMALGATLNKRWNDGTPVLTSTTWQLLVGGIELLIVALAVEGAPPAMTGASLWGAAYLTFFATAFAYFCWFSGFKHLPAATVGVLGLVNPVTGVVLGVALGGETFTAIQVVGILIVVASVIISQRIGQPRRQHRTIHEQHTGSVAAPPSRIH